MLIPPQGYPQASCRQADDGGRTLGLAHCGADHRALTSGTPQKAKPTVRERTWALLPAELQGCRLSHSTGESRRSSIKPSHEHSTQHHFDSQPRSCGRYPPPVDKARPLSLPLHLFKWDVKRAATFRVLYRLWLFGDYEQTEIWCFRTDAELIEDCGLGGERQLRMCLRDMREAGLVEREIAPDGRRGFRLYNREPHAETLPEATQGRPSKTGKIQPERSNRKGLVAKPERSVRTTLLENRGAETVDPTTFALEPEPKTPKPRKSRSKTRLSDLDAGRLFAAQQAARAQVAQRIGKSIGPATLLPGLRKAMDKAFALYPDVDGLCGAMAYRGKTDKNAEQLRWLSGASAFSEKPIGIAYANRIDMADMAPEMKVDKDGWGEEPR